MIRTYPFTPKPLPYSYDALLPVIGEETLYYHYEKLYKNYVNRLNRAISEKTGYKELQLEEIIVKSYHIPSDIEVSRSAGGVYNHEMYFESLKPVSLKQENEFCKSFSDALSGDYRNINDFYEDIAEAAMGVFGSGYAWVSADEKGKIYVAKYANQDTPLTQNAVPLLPIDVWEHAYYLDYRHDRAAHVEKLFDIIDWNVVKNRYCENTV